MAARFGRSAYALALLFAVLPLWAAHQLPMVDLPQHLALISALHRLKDATTLYPEVFASRGELTPYLGYYHLVSLLNWLLPLEVANRCFLTLVVAGLPLSVGFLLHSLGRPRWPSLLALPFSYGDSFGWGFINYLASLPLAVLACGCFVHALEESPQRRQWALVHAVVLLAALLMHVQAFFFLALALPWLLFTTRSQHGWRGRAPALLSCIPAVALFAVWGAGRLLAPAEVAEGAPWKAWGPLFSERNLAFKPFAQNLAELPRVLANQLRDGSDRWALGAVLLLWVAATLAVLLGAKGTVREQGVSRLRLLGLGFLALGLYFTLPFDIRGAIYYLNTRYAHLAAALFAAAVPPLARGLRPLFLGLSAAAALVLALPLAVAFRAFDAEAAPLLHFAALTPPEPRVMGLIFNPGSRVVTHPVFLHAASVMARLKGGITNFSFALTPHSPLRYRGPPPPTFPSEWRPDGFRWEGMGEAYSHFLLRGVPPERLFGSRLGRDVHLVAEEGGMWWLERGAASAQPGRPVP
ncbi:MAG: hypothetical protein ACLQDQ_12260 [Myxococcaceae bacterium]